MIYDVPSYIYKGYLSINIPENINSNNNILVKKHDLYFSDHKPNNLKFIYNRRIKNNFTNSILVQKGVDYEDDHKLIMTKFTHIF